MYVLSLQESANFRILFLFEILLPLCYQKHDLGDTPIWVIEILPPIHCKHDMYENTVQGNPSGSQEALLVMSCDPDILEQK